MNRATARLSARAARTVGADAGSGDGEWINWVRGGAGWERRVRGALGYNVRSWAGLGSGRAAARVNMGLGEH